MKRKRHTEEQIIAILKEAESGLSTADIVRKHGISEQTFYRCERGQSTILDSAQVLLMLDTCPEPPALSLKERCIMSWRGAIAGSR